MNQTPATHWRRFIADSYLPKLSQAARQPGQLGMLQELENGYAYAVAKRSSPGSPDALMLIYAAGLFAFGRLECAGDILDILRDTRALGFLFIGNGVLEQLAQLSTGLSLIAHSEFPAWLERFRPRLRWDEDAGVYVWHDEAPRRDQGNATHASGGRSASLRGYLDATPIARDLPVGGRPSRCTWQ